MRDNTALEDRLEALGAALRGRPRLTDRVMHDVRALAAAKSTEDVSTPASQEARSRRGQYMTAAVAAIGASLLMAIALVPSSSVGWDEVAQAIQSQKWIRGTVTHTDGKRAAMWLSPERQVWAFYLNGPCYFFNGPEKTKYEYRGSGHPITKLPLGDEDAQKVLPLAALSLEKNTIGPWLFGTEKIVQQKRREVTENGKTWIEFQMVLWRGEMNQATLRVDPETKLPVYLLHASPTDATKSSKWQFDYPSEGPADIYALGVPRDTRIDDRMPATEAQRVLDAMAAKRASIGDFRLLVGQPPPAVIRGVMQYPGSVVSRKGDRWRVDSCWPRIELDPLAKPADHQTWVDQFEEQLQLNPPNPMYVCDGRTVWKNSTFQPGAQPRWEPTRNPAPQDLMSGEGLGLLPSAGYSKIASLLFPDLTPKPGWGFEFDLRPADAPGCVLIKRSARLASAEPLRGHEWYYIDPAKGHAVVRVELFNLPADAPADPQASPIRQTLRLEDFRHSPQGFWYCRAMHDMPARPGQQQPAKTTVRYHFDFAAELPDSLFRIENVQ